MERTGFLIEKLLADYRNNASAAQLLITLQLIQKELVVQTAATGEQTIGKRIAVIMPGQVHDSFAEDPGAMTLSYKEIPEPIVTEIPVAETPIPVIPVEKPVVIPEPVIERVPEPKPTPITVKDTKPEINEIMALNGKSLNERLAAGDKEVSEILTGEPLRDLKKGIGVNDRFVFVNDLFRGDETMYERSIKTINGFNIFAEAQYWIERELKIKLGWDDNQHVVKQFYALVKRRFA